MVPSTGSTKAPCVVWKQFQKQLPTVDQLRQWGGQFKPERWGVVTGELAGIVVIDFDGDQGRSLMLQWGINPHVRTGSGGFHWYGIHPGWRVPTLNAKSGKLSWPWPGVDIRGDGGFAILLGRNANGPYQQLRDLVPEPFDVLPLEPRAFLRSHGSVAPKPSFISTVNGGRGNRVNIGLLIEKALTLAGSCGRNNSGFWLACQLRDNGYSVAEAKAAMHEFRSRAASTNTKGNVEQYTDSEIVASLGEAYSRSARDPWARRNPVPQEDCLVTRCWTDSGLRNKDESPARLQEPDHEASANSPINLYLHVGHTGDPLAGCGKMTLSKLLANFSKFGLDEDG
jgi:hypothetical protein